MNAKVPNWFCRYQDRLTVSGKVLCFPLSEMYFIAAKRFAAFSKAFFPNVAQRWNRASEGNSQGILSIMCNVAGETFHIL
jgi:hypothetical protein